MNPPPGRRSHLIPRTRDGRAAVGAFLVLFLLTMPPVTHLVWNRIEPELLGVPFVYVVLLVLYCAQIGVLIWALRRKV